MGGDLLGLKRTESTKNFLKWEVGAALQTSTSKKFAPVNVEMNDPAKLVQIEERTHWRKRKFTEHSGHY